MAALFSKATCCLTVGHNSCQETIVVKREQFEQSQSAYLEYITLKTLIVLTGKRVVLHRQPPTICIQHQKGLQI